MCVCVCVLTTAKLIYLVWVAAMLVSARARLKEQKVVYESCDGSRGTPGCRLTGCRPAGDAQANRGEDRWLDRCDVFMSLWFRV